MKSKTVAALAVASLFWSAGSIANQSAPYDETKLNAIMSHGFPADVNESSFGMSTLTSLDTRTGGYKGWGPMANPYTASSVNESMPLAQLDDERNYQQQLAEVRSARDEVWVANAPLRSEYENIGSTRSQAGGSGGFFSR